MSKFIETNYNTVLHRIFIRAEIKGKWDIISLREALSHQQQLKQWLEKFSNRYFIDTTPETDITEKELIDIVKWLDNFKPPVRLKE